MMFTQSCDQVKRLDKTIMKVFSTQKRMEKKSAKYQKKLGIEESSGADGSVSNEIKFNSIEQKNMINTHGYLFEMINGTDPGKLIINKKNDSLQRFYVRSDQSFNKISDGREVFGWHPYWMGSQWNNYPLDLLSTISYFSYKVDPITGLCQNPNQLNDWENSNFVKNAQESNTKVLLTVSCHGEKNITDFLENETIWDVLINDVTSKVIEKNGDGIDLNFENITLSNRNQFVKFVSNFYDFIYDEFIDKMSRVPYISITLPAESYKESYDIKRLNEFADLFVIMGYDYHDPNEPSAVSPLDSDDQSPNLNTTLDYYNKIGIDKNKTILGLPYYGILWNVERVLGEDDNDEDSIESSIERRLTYSEINKFFLNDPRNDFEIELDTLSMTNKYTMLFEDYSIKEIYYDDAFTLSKKYDLVMSKGFKGIGIWALGYDTGKSEMWNLIDEYFTSDEKIFYNPIDQLNGFPVRLANRLITQKNIFVAIAIYLLIAVIFSFILLLGDWRVRKALVSKKINLLIAILTCFVFLIPLTILVKEFFMKYNIYIKSESDIYIGFFIGILTVLLVSRFKFKEEIKP